MKGSYKVRYYLAESIIFAALFCLYKTPVKGSARQARDLLQLYVDKMADEEQ